MKKEIILCGVIVLSIIIGDILMQKYTNNSLNHINYKLADIKEEINSKENFNMEEIREVDDEWEKNFKVLTCYLEHDELEKIKTQLVIITTGMELKDKEFVIEEIDRAIYIIDHMEAKGMLKLDNIL